MKTSSQFVEGETLLSHFEKNSNWHVKVITATVSRYLKGCARQQFCLVSQRWRLSRLHERLKCDVRDRKLHSIISIGWLSGCTVAYPVGESNLGGRLGAYA